MNKFRDLKGKTFGRLLAIYPFKERAKNGHIIWLCRCDCGNLTKVQSDHLCTGHTKSCGCLQRDQVSKSRFIHGDRSTGEQLRLYNIWVNMKARCSNPKISDYKYYGGKGISVCDEWKNSYQGFKNWALLNGYSNNLVIDRIDNDGNYESSNCQWITNSENVIKSHLERKEKKAIAMLFWG